MPPYRPKISPSDPDWAPALEDACVALYEEQVIDELFEHVPPEVMLPSAMRLEPR
jgi:hypothetical protein